MKTCDNDSLVRIVSIPGPRGPKGDPGPGGSTPNPGRNAFTTTTSPFVMPAAGAQVTVTVADTAWVAVGQALFIEGAGSFEVITVLSATSLRLQALVNTTNTAAGTTLATGKKVTPGGVTSIDTAALDAIAARVTTLESASGNGNYNFYQATAPTGPDLQVGDLWFDTDDGYHLYRWDGTGWADATAALQQGDFGSGLRPVRYFNTGPLPPTGNQNGDLAFLNSDKKLYRWTGSAWTAAVSGTDIVGQIDGGIIVNGTITSGALQTGLIIGDKLAANDVIIRNSLQVANGTIQSAHISTLDAGKITAGNIASVNIGHTGRIFHPTYPDRYFKAVEFATAYDPLKSFGSGSAYSFSHIAPLIAYGPGNASWDSSKPTVCPDAGGQVRVQLQGRLIGHTGLILLYYQINNGGFTPLAARNSADGADAIIDASRPIFGLAPTDQLKLYVAPADGNGNATPGVTCRFELDALFFNW